MNIEFKKENWIWIAIGGAAVFLMIKYLSGKQGPLSPGVNKLSSNMAGMSGLSGIIGSSGELDLLKYRHELLERNVGTMAEQLRGLSGMSGGRGQQMSYQSTEEFTPSGGSGSGRGPVQGAQFKSSPNSPVEEVLPEMDIDADFSAN